MSEEGTVLESTQGPHASPVSTAISTTTPDQSSQLNFIRYHRPPNSTEDLPNKPTFFVPLRLCLSDVLYQTRIIKDEDIQTDATELWNIRDQYLKALNPIYRWSLQFHMPKTLKLWVAKISSWSVLNKSPSNRQVGLLWRWCCPCFRKLSLWDLKEVHEAKVMFLETTSDRILVRDFPGTWSRIY
jgi:hypothetical protein